MVVKVAKKRDEESGGNWMDTYGDMVTLLLTFFVLLYSMSTIEQDKWAKLVRAFNTEGPVEVEQIVFTPEGEGEDALNNQGTGSGETEGKPEEEITFDIDFNELFYYIQSYIEENNMQENIEVKQSAVENSVTDIETADKNIYIQFKNNIIFLPDMGEIRPESLPTMEFLGEGLKSVEEQIALIVVKGHTAISSYSDKDSRILSSERASNISNYFERNFTIPSNKLVALGLGGDYPIATNDTEEGRLQNRRVEIVIISKKSAIGQNEELLSVIGAAFNTKTGAIDEMISE